MIIEYFLGLFLHFIELVLSGFEFLKLPGQFVASLATITCYGVWIVGSDVLALFTASVVFWWGLKFALGLLLFVWEHLPFT